MATDKTTQPDTTFRPPWARELPEASQHLIGAFRTTPAHPPLLFTPLTVRGITFKNRIVLSPQCMYSSTNGYFNDYHLVHLGTYARGGVGLIISEATAISPEGRISPYDTGLWDDDHIPSAKKITDFIRAHGGVSAVQLAHAGRKASCENPYLTTIGPRQPIPPPQPATGDERKDGWDIVGASAVPFDGASKTPHELTVDEIKALLVKWGEAAKRADKAGFDVIEIHGAHGYLISSFLSPVSNKRTDEWGGSFEGRTKFAIEVAKVVRSNFPQEKPISFRISSTDWVEGGWTIEDTVKLSQILINDVGLDFMDLSSGGNSPEQKVQLYPGYQVPFAAAVKKEIGDKGHVMTVGLITTALQAEMILNRGEADFIALGRQLLRDPFWALHAAAELKVDVYWPKQYEWAVNPKSRV